MKTLLTLTTLLVLSSCSSYRTQRQIDDVAWDSLSDESFMRWGSKRLEEQTAKIDVVGCYAGKASETLDQLRKDYLTKGQNADYWLNIGNCYFIREDWSKAEFFYRMTLDEAKTTNLKAVAMNNLGLIHFKYEQWETGKDFLKKASAAAPKFKVPRYNLSQLYLQFGFYDKAIEILNEKSFKDHKDVDVYFSLANAYLYKGDLKQSQVYFSAIPKEQFQREDIAATYSLYLIRTGQIQQAHAVMKERRRSGVPEITAVSQKIEKMLIQKMKEE